MFNHKSAYAKPFVYLMNSLKFTPLRVLALILLTPFVLLVAIIRFITIEIANEFSGFPKYFNGILSDVCHWDEMEE